MTNNRNRLFVAFLLSVSCWETSLAQEQTVGLFLNDGRASEGYTLVTPLFHNSSYLVDGEGRLIHSWEHERRPLGATYLLPDGSLSRGSGTINPSPNFGGRGGTMQRISWEGDVLWDFVYSDSLHALHHDTAVLPNGNVLMIAWEYRTAEEAVAAGRDPELHPMPTRAMWPEQIVEVRPTPPDGGEVVWIWRVWDHLIQDRDSTKANFGVVEDHPELIDINWGPSPNSDWLHFNSVNYNTELDQVMISSPGFDEVWIVDHSTTMEEAAGHTGGRAGKGGDLLYRWGNPWSYRKGTKTDQQIYFSHDAQWVEPGLPGEGNILVFNNGIVNADSSNSSIFEVKPPLNADGTYRRTAEGGFDPGETVWYYEDPGTFYSSFASGEQRMPNGNTLIAESQSGLIFEVTPEGETVWEYVNPVTQDGRMVQGDVIPPSPTTQTQWLGNSIFRAYRYPPDYPAFDGRDMSPKGTIEHVRTAVEDGGGDVPGRFVLNENYPNPFNPSTTITFIVPRISDVRLTVHDALGRRVRILADRRYPRGTFSVQFEATGLPGGIYFYTLSTGEVSQTRSMLLVK